MSETAFDLIVIGAGPGGYVAAIRAAQLGMKVACVDRRDSLGGTCLNVGCIPSKALLNSTHKFHEAKHEFAEIGIMAKDVTMDFPKLMQSKDKAVKGLTGGIEFLFKKNGVEYSKGWGKFSGENSVTVDGIDGKKSEFTAKNIIIATGSEPTSLPAGILDIDEKFVVTSTGALDLKNIPKRMIVVGGGVIGLEMGSVYNRLGSDVTVIQHTDRICPFLDKEVSTQFEKILRKQGMKFQMNTRLEGGVNNKEKGVKVTLGSEKGKSEMEADVVLLSIGRRPFTGGLDLEKAGLETNKFGKIEINKTW